MSSGSAQGRQHTTSIPVAWRRWELWRERRLVQIYVLAVEVAALVVTAALLRPNYIGLADVVVAGALIGLGLAKEEITRSVERLRRRFSDTPHQNMTSVWTLAGAVLLPPGLSAIVVVVLYLYLWRRIWSPVQGQRAWKAVFSAAAITLTCQVASMLMHALGGFPLGSTRSLTAVSIVIVVYALVNLGLVAGAIALMTAERTSRRLFGTLGDSALELATLTLGAVAAVLLRSAPGYVLLLVPALVVLHKNVLVRQLEEAASTDAKTGLLNSATWKSLARAAVDQAEREHTGLGVLMLDLDHFKTINDGHSHLVGDQVLAAVAEQLRLHTRPYDLAGRFGGDEFVLLCPGVDVGELLAIAERVRAAVEQLEFDFTVTASIGAAHYPGTGPTLDHLLLAADNALFKAKDRERNRVAFARQRPITAGERGQVTSGELSN